MNPLQKTVGVVAVANLFSYWITYALLLSTWRATTFWQFLGLEPASPHSYWQSFLIWTFGILGAPASILLEIVPGEQVMVVMVFCSLLNCTIWGVCLGFPSYAISRRLRNGGT